MQIGKSITFYLALLTIFQSCDGKKSINSQQIITEYDKKGNLFRKYNINSSEQRNGKFNEYYDNGNIKFEYNFLNGFPNGEQKQYYRNGVLQAVGYYKNSKPDSLQKWFFPDKNLKSEAYWLDGKLFGIQKKYYDNGNLKNIFFMKDDSNRVFSIDFDENGKMISHSERIIYAIYEKENLTHVDSAKIIFYTITPPSFTYDCNLIVKKGNEVENRDKIILENINNTAAFLYYKEVRNSGNYEIGMSINLKDQYNNMMSDSLFVPLKVR